jgi:hypothetical protein
METIILFWYLLCTGGDCRTVPLVITRPQFRHVHNAGTVRDQ